MLTCLLRPTSGTAKVAGFDICKQPLEVKARIGYVPDELNLYERLTGLEHLYFVGRMFAMDEDILNYRIAILLDMFELTQKKDDMIVDYSHGMQKKIALACALIHDPEVLFLDEPFSGLDPISSKLCRDLLRALSKEGMTIFLSSHDLELVEKLCDEFAIIDKGRIVTSGTTEIIKNNIGNKNGWLEEIFMEHVKVSTPLDLLKWKK